MCNHDCNQGRTCTCGVQCKAVNFVAAVVWAVSIAALLLVLLGVL